MNDDLKARIDALENRVNQLDSFSSSINQRGIYTLRLQLKEFTTNPAPATAGEIAYVAGKVKVCTLGGSSPTWTIVGTQS